MWEERAKGRKKGAKESKFLKAKFIACTWIRNWEPLKIAAMRPMGSEVRWGGGLSKTSRQNTVEGGGCKEQFWECTTTTKWAGGNPGAARIRTPLSLCKTADKGGMCSLEWDSDGEARPERQAEAQWLTTCKRQEPWSLEDTTQRQYYVVHYWSLTSSQS